jgi:hypothetical protein
MVQTYIDIGSLTLEIRQMSTKIRPKHKYGVVDDKPLLVEY